MGKHTSGPWKLEKSSMGRTSRIISQDDLVIAECWNSEQEANARLIASAPELLEACKEALKEFNEMGYTPNYADNMLREAIAKAEGDDTKIGDGDIEDYIGGGLNMPKAEGKE